MLGVVKMSNGVLVLESKNDFSAMFEVLSRLILSGSASEIVDGADITILSWIDCGMNATCT